MTEEQLNQLRFPLGRYSRPAAYNKADIEKHISVIAAHPGLLKKEISSLNDQQLDTPYRPGGWTVRQVVHHLADSHINSYVRFKLALTEDKPTIKPYMEALWAELPDGKTGETGPSLALLEGLHARWVRMMKAMSDADWQKRFVHPEQGREFILYEIAALYDWHCRHHLAHIMNLKEREKWK